MCQLWQDSPFLTYWWQSDSLNVTCSGFCWCSFLPVWDPPSPLCHLSFQKCPDLPQAMSSLRVAPLSHTPWAPSPSTELACGRDWMDLSSCPMEPCLCCMVSVLKKVPLASPPCRGGCACDARVRWSPLGKNCGQDSRLGPGPADRPHTPGCTHLAAHTWPAAADTPPPTQPSQHLFCGGEWSKDAPREGAESAAGFQQRMG